MIITNIWENKKKVPNHHSGKMAEDLQGTYLVIEHDNHMILVIYATCGSV